MRKLAIVFLVVFAMTSICSADSRMEEANGNDSFAHFIRDANNTDDEIKLGGIVISVAPNGDGTADGVAVFETKDRTIADVQVSGDGNRSLVFTDDDANQACTMVDDDGNQYTSNDWTSKIIVKGTKTRFELICLNGEQD
jgi:hypothetical protein